MNAREMNAFLKKLCQKATLPVTVLGTAIMMTACYAAPPLRPDEAEGVQVENEEDLPQTQSAENSEAVSDSEDSPVEDTHSGN